MSTGSEKHILIISLAAGSYPLTMPVSVGIVLTFFSAPVIVLLRRRLPPSFTENVMKTSAVGLSAVLVLFGCLLTAGRARVEKLYELIFIVSLTAVMVAPYLLLAGNFSDLIVTLLSGLILLTYFSSLVTVFFGHRLPAFVADKIVKASVFALAPILFLFCWLLTAGRARPDSH